MENFFVFILIFGLTLHFELLSLAVQLSYFSDQKQKAKLVETGKQNTSKFKFQILATHARWNQFSILCKKRNIFFVWEHQQNTFVTLSGFWLLKGMGVRGGEGGVEITVKNR